MASAPCGHCAPTVQAALRAGAAELTAVGIDEARLDAELLLAHALGVTRAYLYAHPERCLQPHEAAAWQQALARRRRREPVAYIVGTKEFYGLEMAVDRRVLVPRPETEMLVERTLAFAAARPVRTVWDVGTGSGAVALALATHLPEARIVAADASREALQVAAENRRCLGLEDRVELVESDLLAEAHGAIDVVVANLPYLRTDEYLGAMPEVSQYEPRQALDGGPTGLALVERLLVQAAARSPQPALLLLEIGAEQGPEAVALARRHLPARPVALRCDLAGLDRVLEVNPGVVTPPRAGEGVTWVLPAGDPAAIAVVAEALRRGEVAAFPTDTVYGLGAAAFDEAAVQALYEIKGRPEGKAIPLLLRGAQALGEVVADVPPLARRLIDRFWPGGLTLILMARPEVPAVVRAGGPTVAVRVPGHPAARALVRAAGSPLATTSANRSGAPDALTAIQVVEQLRCRVSWVLDGGHTPEGQASSVVDVTVAPPAIRRHGAIPDEALEALFGTASCP